MKSELQTIEKGKSDWFAVYSGSPRFSIACRELKMRHFNLFSLYLLGACIAPLKLLWYIDDEPHHTILSAAKSKLQNFREEDLAFEARPGRRASSILSPAAFDIQTFSVQW